MKRVPFLIFIALCTLPALAQKNEPIVITPGVGVNNIKLGMSVQKVLSLLKGDPRGYSYEDQLEAFASDGTRIDSVMQFVLGFDTCIRYDGELPETMPVFGLYFLKNKLNFITVTSYSATEEQIRLVTLKNGLKFHDSMDDCGNKLAKSEHLNLGYGDYSGDHYYYTLGLEMVYDENKLTAVSIYPVTKDFKTRIAAKTEQLRKEAEAYAPKTEENGDQAPL